MNMLMPVQRLSFFVLTSQILAEPDKRNSAVQSGSASEQIIVHRHHDHHHLITIRPFYLLLVLGFTCYTMHVGTISTTQVVIMMYVFASKINTSMQKKCPNYHYYNMNHEKKCFIPVLNHVYKFSMQVGWKYKINACMEVNQCFGFQ